MNSYHSIILPFIVILFAKCLCYTANSFDNIRPPFSVTRYSSSIHGIGDDARSPRQSKFYIFIPVSSDAGFKSQIGISKNTNRGKVLYADLSRSRKQYNGYLDEPNHNSRSSYFVSDSGFQGAKSWGRQSDQIPQYPLETPSYAYSANHFYPCPKLEKALKRAQVTFNLAVDNKWHGLTEVEAQLFKEDIASLCTVIRSDFHRVTDKLRKSGEFSDCMKEDTFHKAIRKALESLVTGNQDRGWYKRLRWFVGSQTFHRIVNGIAKEGTK